MDKQICYCYHTTERREPRYDKYGNFSHSLVMTVGICYGTRECEQCKCGGDKKKCDFYEEVRNG